MRLQDYIDKHHGGNKTAFGKDWGIHGNNVGPKAKDGKHHIYKIDGEWVMMIEKKTLNKQ